MVEERQAVNLAQASPPSETAASKDESDQAALRAHKRAVLREHKRRYERRKRREAQLERQELVKRLLEADEDGRWPPHEQMQTDVSSCLMR